MYLAKVDI